MVAAAPAREGMGHCERVACARFLNEARGAVSVGRYDRLVVRWDILDDDSAAARGSVIVSGVAGPSNKPSRGALPGGRGAWG